MSKPSRLLAAAAAVLISFALIATAEGQATKASGKSDSGTAYISITHSTKTIEYSAGNNIDKVLGTGAVTYELKVGSGPSTGTFTLTSKKVVIYTPTGSLSGTGSALVTIGATTKTIKNGRLSLKSGTGTEKGHSLVATFTGTGSLSLNQFVFKYKGTYK